MAEAEAWAALQEKDAGWTMPLSVFNLQDARSVSDLLAHSTQVVAGSGVYFLFQRARLIYIGEASRVMTRIAFHLKTGREFDRFCAIACAPEDRKRIEREMIAKLRPTQNLNGHRSVTCQP